MTSEIDAPSDAPKGTTTIDDKLLFDVERLGYRSASTIAASIANAVKCHAANNTLVIAGTQLLSDLANLRATLVMLDLVAEEYDALAPRASAALTTHAPKLEGATSNTLLQSARAWIAPTIAAPAAAIVDTALGLVGLFRQDVEYHGQATTVDALSFELALAAKLKQAGARKVYVPDLMSLSKTRQDAHSLGARIRKAETAKAKAWALVAPLASELAFLEAELDGAMRANDKTATLAFSTRLSELRNAMDPVARPFERIDQRFHELQSHWTDVDATSGLSQLARMMRAESIAALKPLYLHAAVTSSGGFKRISRTLWRTLFAGDGLTFTGGAVARWALLNEDGSVEAGGILSEQCWEDPAAKPGQTP